MMFFLIVYDTQAQSEKAPPSSLALLLFEMILNAKDQNNEFDKPDQKLHLIRFNRIIIAFSP